MRKKKLKKKDLILDRSATETSELNEIDFDKTDFHIVKKIISDYMGDVAPVEEKEIEGSGKERFVILEVENFQDGLKKASSILEIPIIRIKHKIIEKYYKEIDGDIKEFINVEFKEKVTKGNTKVKISDDKLSAYLSVVYPELPNGRETKYHDLIDLIKRQNIKFGIKFDEIKNTVTRLKENYDVLSNILIAQGSPPTKGEESNLKFSVFSDIDEINYIEKHKIGLNEILSSSSLDFIKENFFTVRIVEKGELIAVTTLPEEGEKGIDVFGNEVEGIMGRLLFREGKNIQVKIEDEKIKYYSNIFGYLEYNDGNLVVHSPVWVSEDNMEAYFVKLPNISEDIKTFKPYEFSKQLKKSNIKYGIKNNIINSIVDILESGDNDFELILIAEGVKEKKGENARIELFFEEEKTPGKILKDGSMDYREIDLVKKVKENQLIAVKHFAKNGTPGIDLRGNTTLAKKGKDKNFTPVNNVRVEFKKTKALYYSTIEGSVTLIGDSGISVNQVYNVDGNVDFNIGNIDFSGSVDVKGSVISGFKITAEGDINIKGMVNPGAELKAEGNINILQGVLGREGDTKLIAKGSVSAQYIQNSMVVARCDVVVKDYIIGSFIRAGGSVITPNKEIKIQSKGSIMGGEIIAKKSVIANSVGSEYTQSTKITVGVDYEFDQKFRNFQKSLDYCESQISKIKKTLKLGFQDTNMLKERIKKLPLVKQKPFLNGFKRLDEINVLKNRVLEKRNKFSKEIDELSKNARVIVHKELFSQVFIQIGEAKYRTENYISKVKIKQGKNKKEMEFESL
ncbi:MAG: DUF342 domain-containing protein [Candidatus Helarchaeota archaeon]|nr:DUF342 domain-containing protein [Candidatus Helarchaeota archaeon]